MISREAYQDMIADILIRQHGWKEEDVDKVTIQIGHGFMKGVSPEKVVAALVSPRAQTKTFRCGDGKHFTTKEKAIAHAEEVFARTWKVISVE